MNTLDKKGIKIMIGIIRRILKPIAAWVLKEEMEGAERTINNQTEEIRRLSVEMAKTKEELKRVTAERSQYRKELNRATTNIGGLMILIRKELGDKKANELEKNMNVK